MSEAARVVASKYRRRINAACGPAGLPTKGMMTLSSSADSEDGAPGEPAEKANAPRLFHPSSKNRSSKLDKPKSRTRAANVADESRAIEPTNTAGGNPTKDKGGMTCEATS